VKVQTFERRRSERVAGAAGTRRWIPMLALSGLAALILFQAWAYYARIDLSLGPRVILEPWLLRHGFLLYEDIANLHTPLMPLALAALEPLFPDGLALARLALLALLSLTTLLTFAVARRRIGWLGALWAAGFVVLWSPIYGYAKLWYESFLTPLYLLLLLFYDPAAFPRSRRAGFLFGLLGGTAILVKQHAALVFVALVLWSAFATWQARRSMAGVLRQVGFMSVGAFLPPLAYAAYQYATSGTLEGFLYWTITFNLTSGYRSLGTLPAPSALILRFVSSALLLPGAIYSLVAAKRRGDGTWAYWGWALVLLAASSATLYPRFATFHLQPALPVLALLSAWTLARLLRPRNAGRHVAIAFAGAVSLFWLFSAVQGYQPVIAVSARQKVWEYSDLVPLAREVRQQIGPDDCIYLFPDDEATSNLYYLTGCAPPVFWVFHYPWYMLDWIRARILLTLEAHPPEWVLYFPGHSDRAYAPDIVDYLHENYRQEGSLPWAEGQVWLLKRLP
jgi:hypothetical protein